MGLCPSWSPVDGEPTVPELLSMRTVDADDGFEAHKPSPAAPPRRGIETTILEGLMKAYPLAPVVEEVDDRFLRLLDAIARLDLDPSRRA
jgi:hypothetical protein